MLSSGFKVDELPLDHPQEMIEFVEVKQEWDPDQLNEPSSEVTPLPSVYEDKEISSEHQQFEDCDLESREGKDCNEEQKSPLNFSSDLLPEYPGVNDLLEIIQGEGNEGGSSSHLRCQLCPRDFTFKNSKSLLNHMHKFHVGPHASQIYTCAHCSRSFRLLQNMRQHEQRVHSLDPTRCEECGKIFKNRDTMRRHAKLYHTEQPTEQQRFVCTICGSTFSLKCNLVHHQRTQHDPNAPEFHCVRCGSTFKSRWSLQKHVSRQHELQTPGQRFCCLFCDKSFPLGCSLRAHENSVHGGATRFFPCPQGCGRILINKIKMSLHMRTCTGPEQRTCRVCGATFVKGKHLEYHMINVHGPNQFVNCHFCAKDYSCKSSLQRHLISIHLEKTITPELQQHPPDQQAPDSIKEQTSPAHDEIDETLITSHDTVQGREEDSSVQGQRQCTLCNKLFKNNGSLKRHLVLYHTGSKAGQRFPCTLCESTFSLKCALNRHVRNAHGKQSTTRHPCPYCSKSLKTRESLQGHVKRCVSMQHVRINKILKNKSTCSEQNKEITDSNSAVVT